MAGLAAAQHLSAAGADVIVLEGSSRVGGKLMLGEVGGLALDLGAESILARRPEGLDMMHALGLDVVNPATTDAAIWTRGALRPMPPTVLGVPADEAALSASGIAEISPQVVDVPDGDVSVGEFVGRRLGSDVVDRLVEPLLGGVYAGHADELSLQATAPQIAALGPDLLAGAKLARSAAKASGPVFAGLVGGVGRLTGAIADSLQVRLDSTVRQISRTADGWQLSVGPTTDVEVIDVDAVVVAAPAPAAARLLAEVAPDAAFALAAIDYASVAIVTYVFPAGEPMAFSGSGFLVPPVDGTFIKAATVSSNKWGWVRDSGHLVIRASVGRAGEATLLQTNDADITARALADLRTAFGGLPEPIDAHVQRWGGGLPQYAVGHLDRVETIDRDIAGVPGLEVCGAAYRGIGIPAVIASGQAAAGRLLDGTMTT